METLKHTPGPWKVHEEHTGSPEHSTWWRIDSSSRFHMAKLEVFDVTAKHAHSEEHARNVMSEYYETMDEVRANAALIAAAPTLLKALIKERDRAVTNWCMEGAKHGFTGGYLDLIDRFGKPEHIAEMDAAIAQATS